MKICNLKSAYINNPFSLMGEGIRSNNSFTPPFFRGNIFGQNSKLVPLAADCVSFGQKNYNLDSIKEQTGHCAYCGCKVYTEEQLKFIAEEILNNKSKRMEAKVKSVIGRLSGAKHSEDLAAAKQSENADEIKFFEDFLRIAATRPFLKGNSIFNQCFGLNDEQAMELLLKNLQPLLATVDHVSPQRENHRNDDSDLNLVEACYTCNHDIKQGYSFGEFYTLFPSIKDNMPENKFKYAKSGILENSQSEILKNLSATALLKFLSRLFVQRTEAINRVESINFSIKNCVNGIKTSIEKCQADIAQKEAEITALHDRYAKLQTNPLFGVMVKRKKYEKQLDEIESLLTGLRVKRQHCAESKINLETKKTNKSNSNGRNGKNQLTPEQREAKIKELDKTMASLSGQIEAQEKNRNSIISKIAELNAQYPTVEMLQSKKRRMDLICKYHTDIKGKKQELQKHEKLIQGIDEQLANLQAGLEVLNSLGELSEEDIQIVSRYKDLMAAMTILETEKSKDKVRNLINNTANDVIQREFSELNANPSIKKYQELERRTELEHQISALKSRRSEANNKRNNTNKEIRKLSKFTELISPETAAKNSAELSEQIKNLISLEHEAEIPEKISCLKTEILLLNETIDNLRGNLAKIDEIIPDDNT